MYFIDTNIFLEIELKQNRSDECKEFLKKVLRGELKAFTSDFNLDSVAVVMDTKKSKPKSITDFLIKIMGYEGLTIYSSNMLDRIVATKYMQEHKLSFDDAITYFIARSLGIKYLVSFDSDFDRLPGIKRIEPANIVKKRLSKEEIRKELEKVKRIAKMVSKKIPKGRTSSVDIIREHRD